MEPKLRTYEYYHHTNKLFIQYPFSILMYGNIVLIIYEGIYGYVEYR